MKKYIYKYFLLFIAGVVLFACQKEVSQELADNPSGPANPGSVASGWSFTGPLAADYHGCIDTAYIEKTGNTAILTIDGFDSASNTFSLVMLAPDGKFQTGSYGTMQGAVFVLETSSGSYVSSGANALKIQVSFINDTAVALSFSAVLSNLAGGAGMSITNGKLDARIGKPNACKISTPSNGGGGTGGIANPAVFTLGNAQTACVNAKISGQYQASSALNSDHFVELEVTVQQPGEWSLSTATVNGMQFKGSGSFQATGKQIIELEGAGTPAAEGVFLFPVVAGSSNCSFSITVAKAEEAGCTPADNTVRFSVAGITDIKVNTVTTKVSGGSYEITGNGSGGDVTIEFAGTTQPKPGKYRIQNIAGDFNAGDVRLSLVSSNLYWQSSRGNLFVSIVNGKAVITFCNIEFSGTFGGPSFATLASGKIIEK